MATDGDPAGQRRPADPAAALAERLFHDVTGALELFTVYLGERLGLYRALDRDGPFLNLLGTRWLPAIPAGFRSMEVLPLETETWRFYRLTP